MDLSLEVDGLRLSLNSPFTVRQSAVRQYLNCHRLYGWERVAGLVPDRPSIALEFGSATHLFLQERKRGLPMAEAMQKGIHRLLQNYPKAMFPGDDLLLEEHRQLAQTLWPMHEAYWADAEEQVLPLGQEVKGRVEVGHNTNIFLVFQLDRLVSWQGSFWIWDYKTMAKNDDRQFRKYEIDLQPTCYVYAASKVLGSRIAGIVIDGLIKTRVPQFRREHYLRTDEELAEFEAEFPEIAREMAWRHKRVEQGEDWKSVFFRNTDHCFRYYQCPFFQLCQRDTPMNRMAYTSRTTDYMDNPALLEGGADAPTENA